MDSLETISKVFLYLLPIFGVIVLAVLAVLLIRLLGLLKNVNITVNGVNSAVDTTNGYLKELDTTVKSVNNMAMSVEAVRATTERAVKKTAKKWSKQYDQVKAAVTDALEKTLASKEEKPKEEAPKAEKPKEAKPKDPKNIVRVASVEPEPSIEDKAAEAVKEVIEAAAKAVEETGKDVE